MCVVGGLHAAGVAHVRVLPPFCLLSMLILIGLWSSCVMALMPLNTTSRQTKAQPPAHVSPSASQRAHVLSCMDCAGLPPAETGAARSSPGVHVLSCVRYIFACACESLQQVELP